MRGAGAAAWLAAMLVACQRTPDDRLPVDAQPDVASCPWLPANAVPLSLPHAEVKGVLQGASRNASTTCTRLGGTGGPEQVLWFAVSEPTLVTMAVTSRIDTALAIRSACDDPTTEIACSDGPLARNGIVTGPIPIFDPKATVVPPSGPNPFDAEVRAVVEAGTYYVLVEETSPFGVGGPFTLNLDAHAAPANLTCIRATPLGAGEEVRADLTDALAPAPACPAGARTSGGSLYYRVTVPAGGRLKASAAALLTSSWFPSLQLYEGCDPARCVAAEFNFEGATAIVHFDNPSPQPRDLLLVVTRGVFLGAPVTLDGQFKLSVQTAPGPLADP